jgi:hypothetical protein
MTDPDTFASISAALSLLLVAIGAWTIHSRQRSRSSRFFWFSLVAIFAWLPASIFIEYFVLSNYTTNNRNRDFYNYLYIAKEIVIPALLILMSSISFFFMARTIKKSA